PVPPVVLSLTFPVADLPPPVRSVMAEFRLMVNRGIRFALEENKTARGSIPPSFRQTLMREHRVNSTHVAAALEVALTCAKGHRRLLRKGRAGHVPYCRRPFLKTSKSSFHIDPDTGKVRLSLRNGEWVSFFVPVSQHARRTLLDPKVRLKALTLTERKLSLAYEVDAPEPYVPEAAIALDTNERSLDGVLATPSSCEPVVVPFPEVKRVQQTHFERRRRLGRKKAHDRRVKRRLLGREGKREHDRVNSRLHMLTNTLVATARENRAVLVLEDLKLPQGGGRGRRQRRGLSSWPQGELHRQIRYKSALHGVPLITVNPRYTSKTCPRCGVRAERVGKVFDCAGCGWSLDRQRNAGINIYATARRETAELGGLRFDLDALAKDVVIPLY
ncbi:MAG: transposase, partial [Euryarchaeota archaeon]|nr:transposase [Euryarchaeota archaeon]